jgi:hypothetical protein
MSVRCPENQMEATMPIEREVIVERTPTETVFVGGGSPFRIVGFIVAGVLAVLLILWLANGGISSNGDSVNVDLPNVTVTQ